MGTFILGLIIGFIFAVLLLDNVLPEIIKEEREKIKKELCTECIKNLEYGEKNANIINR